MHTKRKDWGQDFLFFQIIYRKWCTGLGGGGLCKWRSFWGEGLHFFLCKSIPVSEFNRYCNMLILNACLIPVPSAYFMQSSLAPFITDAMLLVSISTMSTVALGWDFRREDLATSARFLFLQTKQISIPSPLFKLISLSAAVRPTPLKIKMFSTWKDNVYYMVNKIPPLNPVIWE